MNYLPILQQLLDPVLQRAGSGNLRLLRQDGPNVIVAYQPLSVDAPKLIGKGGATIKALVALAGYLGKQNGQSLTFTITESIGPRTHTPPVKPDRHWKPDAVVDMVKAYLTLAKQRCPVEAIEESDRWRIIITAQLPPEIHLALGRWISVCALSKGGRAWSDHHVNA